MAKYLPTAMAQLQLAIKLMHAAEQGEIDLDAIDQPLSIEEPGGVMVLEDRLFYDPNDFINGVQNMVCVAFGVAAITLNRALEEAGCGPPKAIDMEEDQYRALVFQIRNAFAHDMAEPRWRIKGRYARQYDVASVQADLRDLDGKMFEYSQIGGARSMVALYAYATDVLGWVVGDAAA